MEMRDDVMIFSSRAENAMIHNDLEFGLNPDFLMKRRRTLQHMCCSAKLAVCNILLHFFFNLTCPAAPCKFRYVARLSAWVAVHRISADAGRSCAPLVMSHSRPFRPTFSFRSHFQFHVTSSLDPCKNGGGNHLSRLSVCHFLHLKYVESIHNVLK